MVIRKRSASTRKQSKVQMINLYFNAVDKFKVKAGSVGFSKGNRIEDDISAGRLTTEAGLIRRLRREKLMR